MALKAMNLNMWVTFYVKKRGGQPLIIGYKADGEDFACAQYKMTTSALHDVIVARAHTTVKDVIAIGAARINVELRGRALWTSQGCPVHCNATVSAPSSSINLSEACVKFAYR